MDYQAIRRAQRRTPFTPFKMRMVDGKEFFVPHPEYVVAERRLVHWVNSETERGEFLEPYLIAALEFTDGSTELPALPARKRPEEEN